LNPCLSRHKTFHVEKVAVSTSFFYKKPQSGKKFL
jgi:hypothetical protein